MFSIIERRLWPRWCKSETLKLLCIFLTFVCANWSLKVKNINICLQHFGRHLCSPAVVSPKGIPMNWLILRWDHWVCSQLPCNLPGMELCWNCIVLYWDCVRMGLLWDWDVKRIKLHSQYQLTHALDGHTRPRYAIQGPANCFMNNRANNCRQEKGVLGEHFLPCSSSSTNDNKFR